MGQALSAQVVSMIAHSGMGRSRASGRNLRVVAGEIGPVKLRPVGIRAEIDLLRPPFEAELAAGPRLWLRRFLWRRRLRAAFQNEADTVLEDFGLSRERLARYLIRPFWQP